jgi:Fe-S cluster biogenesis protein NfuA
MVANAICVDHGKRVFLEEVKAVIGEVLAPLLEADGGGVEFVSIDGDEVTLRLLGAAAVCTGERYTRVGVIEPLLKAAMGRPVKVKIERAFTRPQKRDR